MLIVLFCFEFTWSWNVLCFFFIVVLSAHANAGSGGQRYCKQGNAIANWIELIKIFFNWETTKSKNKNKNKAKINTHNDLALVCSVFVFVLRVVLLGENAFWKYDCERNVKIFLNNWWKFEKKKKKRKPWVFIQFFLSLSWKKKVKQTKQQTMKVFIGTRLNYTPFVLHLFLNSQSPPP